MCPRKVQHSNLFHNHSTKRHTKIKILFLCINADIKHTDFSDSKIQDAISIKYLALLLYFTNSTSILITLQKEPQTIVVGKIVLLKLWVILR